MIRTFKHIEWKNEGNILRGSLYQYPDADTPWIIFCHGFRSHRIGPNYFFVSMQRYLLQQGISSLSFDFSGCGESEGLFKDMTITSLKSDLVSAHSYLTSLIASSQIYLLGHSFGGTIASLVLNTVKPKGIILISPLADTKKHAKDHEHILSQGVNADGCYEFGPNEMRISFLDDFKSCDPIEPYKSTKTSSLLLLQGDQDQRISIAESKKYLDTANTSGMNTKYHILENTDHRFSTVPSRTFVNTIITQWIKEQVV